MINSKHNVIINDCDNKGNGITRIDNFVVFVPHSFKDEQLYIEVIDIKKRYGVGKIVDIIKPSPLRKNVNCPYYNECGGCSFLHSDYEYEKETKINYIEKLFNLKIDKSYFGNEYNYRNKVSFHVKDNKVGFFSEKTNNLIEVDNCLLIDNRINEVLKFIKQTNLNNISSITIRVSSNEIMIIVDNEYDYNELLKHIKIDSIYIKDRCVYGKKYITEEIDNIKYTINPEAFFQINTTSMIELYNIIKEYSGNSNSLLDLYCGTGTIGIFLKDNYKNITGIEINSSSIKNANINKEINKIDNIDFILGDSKKAKNKYDTIIVDPPRSGLSKEVVNYLNNSESKIIYVSCNPDTLKRDIELLDKYSIDKLSVVNMFPRTKHIECVCILKVFDLVKS